MIMMSNNLPMYCDDAGVALINFKIKSHVNLYKAFLKKGYNCNYELVFWGRMAKEMVLKRMHFSCS